MLKEADTQGTSKHKPLTERCRPWSKQPDGQVEKEEVAEESVPHLLLSSSRSSGPKRQEPIQVAQTHTHIDTCSVTSG